MAKIAARTWWWVSGLAAATLLLVGLIVALVAFYHPLTLASKIDSHDVVAYVEWNSFPKLPLQSAFLANLQNQLGCSLEQCDFWGKENALVLRSSQDVIMPEIYLYQANKNKLTETWQHLADGSHKVLWANHEYSLHWQGDIAIIAAQTVTLAEISTIANMPWVKDAEISNWGTRSGLGYCSLACIDWINQQLPGQLASPMFSAFLQSTLRYLAFTFTNEAPLHLQYHLFFTDQYHHPLSSKRNERQATLNSDTLFAFSGDNFANKLGMLEGNSQNSGLWQTVQSIWSNTATGQAWWNIAKGFGNYPYTLYLGSTRDRSRLVLDVPEESKESWKSQLEKNMAQYASVLFPQQKIMLLPDGTSGLEYIKNNQLRTEWRAENGSDMLVILDEKQVVIFRLYLSHYHDHVELSLTSPLQFAQASNTCFRSGVPVEELTIMQVPTWPFVVWNTVEESSTQVVKGNVYFDNTDHKC